MILFLRMTYFTLIRRFVDKMKILMSKISAFVSTWLFVCFRVWVLR